MPVISQIKAREIPLTDSGQGNLEGAHYGWVDARRKTELPGFKANPAQQEDMISSNCLRQGEAGVGG